MWRPKPSKLDHLSQVQVFQVIYCTVTFSFEKSVLWGNWEEKTAAGLTFQCVFAFLTMTSARRSATPVWGASCGVVFRGVCIKGIKNHEACFPNVTCRKEGNVHISESVSQQSSDRTFPQRFVWDTAPFLEGSATHKTWPSFGYWIFRETPTLSIWDYLYLFI